MLIVPAVLGLVFLLFRLDQRMAGLYFMRAADVSAGPDVLAGAGCAPGLDVALTLATLIVSMAITPLTASFFTHVYLGTALASPLAFGLKLFLIIGGCALAATVIRRLAGQSFVEAQHERIDGLSVLAMSMFAIAAMDGVVDHFRADPLLVIGLTGLAFALALGMLALTALVFAGRARPRLCDRTDCWKPKCWPDAGCHRLCNTRCRLAVFRACAVSHLSVATPVEAAGKTPVE